MKWIDLKNKIESIGVDDDTGIRLFLSTYDGDYYELNIEEIEDKDRQDGYGNIIDICLSDPPKEYRDYFNDSYVQEMINELNEVIRKYT